MVEPSFNLRSLIAFHKHGLEKALIMTIIIDRLALLDRFLLALIPVTPLEMLLQVEKVWPRAGSLLTSCIWATDQSLPQSTTNPGDNYHPSLHVQVWARDASRFKANPKMDIDNNPFCRRTRI